MVSTQVLLENADADPEPEPEQEHHHKCGERGNNLHNIAVRPDVDLAQIVFSAAFSLQSNPGLANRLM